jgi:membrane dipeptidase
MLIVDAHEDLAWNMLTFGRDYTRSAEETRRQESGSLVALYNDDTMLGWPEYQRGRVAVIFASLFATPLRLCTGAWDILCYADADQACRLYQAQLDAYNRMQEKHPDKYSLISTQKDLEIVLAPWQRSENEGEAIDQSGKCVGLVILMEGAEGIRLPEELEEWWTRGVRVIGPAWAGTRFCGGTREPGLMSAEGFALLDAMTDLGFCLDISHMDELSALQALNVYQGCIIASHSNALSMVKGSNSNRHLSDRLIQGILERDGVIGVVPYNGFLKADWKRGDRRDEVSLLQVVSQIDYICQMAGDAHHTGIGSDYDGGFGVQSTPLGIETIADLQKLEALLREKGYDSSDIEAILGGNWLKQLRLFLPETV